MSFKISNVFSLNISNNTVSFGNSSYLNITCFQTNCTDLRFIQDNTTELPYWRQDFVNYSSMPTSTYTQLWFNITSNASSSSTGTIGNVAFAITATSTPSGATITYKWQQYNGSAWVDVANTSGRYFNNTSPTFTANNVTANGNVFRAMVSVTGGNTVYSGSATILYVTP